MVPFGDQQPFLLQLGKLHRHGGTPVSYTHLDVYKRQLVRWPRLARPAVVPDTVEGRTVTAIAATAFAASHLDES